MKGFLGTGATFSADLNLVVQIAMGLALLYGMYLARRRNFKAHKYCQSLVMILNIPMILIIMAPSFHRQVEHEIPSGLGDPYYLLPTIHATLGTVAELLGIYIVLVAGTKILPRRLKFKRFKPWMRTALALWWATILLGVGTYYFWYIAPASKAAQQPTSTVESAASTPEKVMVKISNFQFEPKEVTISEGTTVEWVDETGRHTVEADDGSFKSETMVAGGRFQHKFDKAGRYPYYCGFHGDKGGADMAGVITVTPRSK
jgi:plastocyanin